MKLSLSCNPLDVLIVMCIPYDDDNDKIRNAYEEVQLLALNFTYLGYKPAENLWKFIANQKHKTILFNDVDYEMMETGVYNLMAISMPFGAELDKWLKRKNIRDTMKELGDEEYEDYVFTLGVDSLLCKKMETEKRLRDELAERIVRNTLQPTAEVKRSNCNERKQRKPRNDKGKPRGQYKKRINKKAPAN